MTQLYLPKMTTLKRLTGNYALAGKMLAVMLCVLASTGLKAQTTLLSPSVNNGGFESGTTGWSFVQNTASTTNANRWETGSVPVANSGTNAAYITTGASGLPYAYNTNQARRSHMYRDITFPAGETNINLSFYWKAYGESGGYDNLIVYLAPTSFTPTTSAPSGSSNALSGAIMLWEQPNTSQSSYTQATVSISAADVNNLTSSSTMRLIFTWKNDGSGGTSPGAAVDDITLTTSCGPTATSAATNVTNNSATLNWSAISGATGYQVRYKLVSDPTSVTTWATPTSVSGNGTTSVNVSSLTANSLYEFQVVPVGLSCSNYTSSRQFTTLCNSSSLTQTEGFNSSTMPSCWSTQIVTSGSTQPAISFVTSLSNPSGSVREGTNAVKFNSYNASSGSQIRLVSLPVSTSGISSVDVAFLWYRDNSAYTGSSYASEGVQVQYSLDGTTWTNVGSFFGRIGTFTGWEGESLTLPSAAANVSKLYVGFLFTSAVGNNCYMDSVVIKQTPSCGVPTGITGTPTSSATATISWSAPSAGIPTGYQYVVSTSNTTPSGAGTNASGTSVNVGSLSPSTTYYVFMRTNCSGTFSSWSASSSFTTPCAAAAIPQTEGFNSTTMPSCWTTQIVTNGSTQPTISFESVGYVGSTFGTSFSPREGTHMVKFNSYNASSGSQVRLVSLPVSTTGAASVNVNFLWRYSNSGSLGTEGVQVQYSTDGTNWTNAGSAIPRYDANKTWDVKTLTLPAAAANASMLYVGFLFTSQWGYNCFMDSVKIEAGPSCVGPSNITITNVTNNSATINWGVPVAGNNPAGYQYVVSTSNTTPSGAGTNATGLSVTVNSLPPSTRHYVFLRTNCGGSSFSSWVAADSFTTQCDGATLPFKESFTTTSLPSCWAVAEGSSGASYHWEPYTADASHGVDAPYAGSYFLRLHVFLAPTSYNPYYLKTLPINVPNGNTDLSYYYFLGSGGYTGTTGASGSDPYPLSVEVSTDYGTNWTNVYNHNSTNSTFATSSATTNWTQNTISLNAYKGQTIMVRFKGVSNYGSNTCNMALDEIAVSLKAPTATNSTQCGTGTPTASVSSNTGVTTPVFKWYTSSTGNTVITGQSGSTLSNYSISATTTFYVSEVIGTAESERVPVVATYNPQPTASVTSSTNVTCFGGNNGTATVTASGGTSYTYSWNTTPAQTTATASNLSAGTYTVTVKNSNNTCPTTANITITEPTAAASLPAIATHPQNSTICANTNTSFSASATGLNITYQWQVNTGSGFSNVSNGGVYSGATSSTLTITGATASMTGYQYRVIASGTCSPSATSNAATLTVNMTIPSVSTTATATTICNGTNVTFTATPTNGGTTPTYQWKKNGNPVGTNSSTYSSNTLANSDVITVDMTSNANCPIPATVTSTGITMTVNPILTPSVSITASTSTTICAGTNVTFTATPTNGGSSPSYQWKKNGFTVGTNSNTYATNGLTNGDVITCVLTTSVPCPTSATATSNSITMTVNPVVTPTISISASATTICAGTSVTFTSNITNGGSNPGYAWKKNGFTVSTNASYTTNSLANGDVIVCQLTSSLPCPNPSQVTSNSVTMVVNPILVPGVNITANTGNTICNGTTVTYTATPTNGGNTPSYQWKKNNLNVGTSSTTYTATGLVQGDVITCVMTTSVPCPTSNTATSNSIVMTVNPILTPQITIAVTDDTICAGDPVTFSVSTVNPGNAPQYQWKLNNQNIPGATASTYSTSSLTNGSNISCVLTSNATCVSPAKDTSNTIAMTVNPLLTPEVYITASPDSTVCTGAPVVLTAHNVNGGVIPGYQWKINGVNMTGARAGTYTLNNLSDGDVVSLDMTSTATCPVPAMVSSNSIKFKVEPTTPPLIYITASPSYKIKEGDTVTFTATILNAGTRPTYQWMKNDTVIANATGGKYVANNLQNNDKITLVVYSSRPCSDPDSGISNSVTIFYSSDVNGPDRKFADMRLYPNPNSGSFTLEAKFGNVLNDEHAKVEVLSGVGQLIFKEEVAVYGGELKKDIRLSGIANGTYYIRLTAGDQSAIKPISIQQ